MGGLRGVALGIALALAGASAAAQKPGWPAVGDRWVYEARDADRPRNKYEVVVQVEEISPSSISDVFRPEDGPRVMQTHRAGAYLRSVAPGIAEFSPYLGAFQELRGGEIWPVVEYKQLWECGVGLVLCDASARVVGKEKVTVRAGTFEAWKIVVDFRPRMGGSAAGSGEFVYWIAEQTKRAVKLQTRVNFVIGGHYAWPQPDMEMELVSYVPAGTR